VATWADVDDLAARLDRATPGVAHEGSPTWDVGPHPFARLRLDDGGREILQFWSMDLDSEAALASRRDVFFHVATFSVKCSIWAWLDRLDRTELAEILEESWRARRGVR